MEKRKRQGQSPLMTYVVRGISHAATPAPYGPMQALQQPLGMDPPGPTAHAPPLATPPAAQVAGTLFVVALVMYLLRFLTKVGME